MKHGTAVGVWVLAQYRLLTIHPPQPGSDRFRLRPQVIRVTNLRVMLHDMRVGTGQVLHMPGQSCHKASSMLLMAAKAKVTLHTYYFLFYPPYHR